MAPVQVGIVPISERHLGYAEKVQATLQNAGLRVEVDPRNEKMGAKIRDFTMQKVPYLLVVGDKEAETGGVSLRVRGEGDKGGMALEEFVGRARGLVESRSMSL
jgi:threonyl-tRNA synthetase